MGIQSEFLSQFLFPHRGFPTRTGHGVYNIFSILSRYEHLRLILLHPWLFLCNESCKEQQPVGLPGKRALCCHHYQGERFFCIHFWYRRAYLQETGTVSPEALTFKSSINTQQKDKTNYSRHCTGPLPSCSFPPSEDKVRFFHYFF